MGVNQTQIKTEKLFISFHYLFMKSSRFWRCSLNFIRKYLQRFWLVPRYAELFWIVHSITNVCEDFWKDLQRFPMCKSKVYTEKLLTLKWNVCCFQNWVGSLLPYKHLKINCVTTGIRTLRKIISIITIENLARKLLLYVIYNDHHFQLPFVGFSIQVFCWIFLYVLRLLSFSISHTLLK